jgi:hypothetical protein
MAPFSLNFRHLWEWFVTKVDEATGVAYLLKTDFSAATPATLTNGQVLDTAAEGMVVGSLTVVDTSSGSVAIASSKLVLTGNLDWPETGVISQQAFTASIGRIFKATGAEQSATCRAIVGVGESSALFSPPNAKAAFYPHSDTTLYVGLNGFASIIKIGNVSNTGTYDLAFVIGDGLGFFFIKGGEFPLWTLLFAPSLSYSNPLYAGAAVVGSGGNNKFSALEVTETLYPNLVTTVAEDDFSEADGTAISGKALDKGGNWTKVYEDGAVTHTVQSGKAVTVATTASGSGWFEVSGLPASDILVTADITTGSTTYSSVLAARSNANGNFVAARDAVQANVLPGSSNSFVIYEVVAGSAANRAASNTTVANSTTYNCQLRVVGASVTAILGSIISLSGTLATPKTHGSAMFVNGDGNGGTGTAVDNFKVYPATGYDSVLDAI